MGLIITCCISVSCFHLQDQDLCAKPVGSSTPATLLEVLMASRPAQVNRGSQDVPPPEASQADVLLADGNTTSSSPGRLSQKRRQRERRSLDMASKRQKSDLQEQPSQVEAPGKFGEASKAQPPMGENHVKKVEGKEKKASQLAAELDMKKASAPLPEQRPGLKPTANQRKKARKRARQRLSSESAMVSSSEQKDRVSNVLHGDTDNAARKEGLSNGSKLSHNVLKHGTKANGVVMHKVIKTKTQNGRGNALPEATTLSAPPSKGIDMNKWQL